MIPLIVPATFAGTAGAEEFQRSVALTRVGTVSVNPANQGGAGSFNQDVTITCKAGDLFFLVPPATLEDTLTFIGASTPTDNTLRIRLRASGAVDGAALEWFFMQFSKDL
jgi:hypothetical protein